MRNEERAALAAVQFNWAVTPDAIWSPVEHHVPGLHANVVRTVMASVGAARRSTTGSPIGIALEGEKGVGKTHLLGWVRQQVQESEGYFFLIKLVSGAAFWSSAVRGVIDGFDAGQGEQLSGLLRRLGEQAGLDHDLRARLLGQSPVSRGDLDEFVAGVKRIDAKIGTDCQNTARALVLYRSPETSVQEIGYGYFELDGDVEEADRDAWGFRRGGRLPQQILGDLSRLLALTGPSVIAIDQIDSVMAQAATGRTDAGENQARTRLANEIADGLMELRESTHRTLSVVACIPATWELIRTQATSPAADRFRTVNMQSQLPDPAIAVDLVAGRLAGLYVAAGLVPPYPTWPVLRSAFENDGARDFTPRRLLQRVDEHIRRCLETDELTELASLEDAPAPVRPGRHTAPTGLSRLDAKFADLREQVDIDAALDSKTEDARMPALLAAALSSYIAELGELGREFELDPPPGPKPALHARLRRTLDETTDDEMTWGFRAIASDHARAALTRLRAARTEAGLEAGMGKRKLIVLRNTRWSSGPKTAAETTEFEAAGGLSLLITRDDLKTFAALEALTRQPDPGFLQWLIARRPAGNSELFQRVFAELDQAPQRPKADSTEDAAEASGKQESGSVEQVGRRGPGSGEQMGQESGSGVTAGRPGDGEPVVPIGAGEAYAFNVPLRLLRKHTVAFAGSGSGKTVLLRRLIEECALHGVSSIVLDPNNDLARLGDPWPEPPPYWGPGDDAKAREYINGTDVVIWTPRRAKGRPLSFRPLPDFADVLDDEDEFRDAVDAAVAGLLPRAQLTPRKVKTGQAVLRQALDHFARRGGHDLNAFIELLADLPTGISTIRTAHKVAAEIADALTAERVNDPLFGGTGQALDPGVLLTPAPGYRARVSVISFVGLPANEQRQSFVNQLQMALFAWIKRNPAGDRPLGGLLVMDEAQTFAPSGAATACTESTLALAAQARKYGLGLVFATQAPKGLHNRIPGNATTQFFGRLNSGAQINAATELARAMGGRVDDIGRLSAGNFYGASEGLQFEKLQIPMSLSHHPPSALTTEEVITRAAHTNRPLR
ncbi:MAG TPA: DUF87 domain-containing protein [Kribbella sp.]|uniref:ATP-binding protein n=1 Tax=Kribbella sp. TaxID=1871183 RepID=UPI002D7952BC|nr:DUF87 domain-containing protein [Kribbella sp.]HET6292438.1 DUF87 domain-containing protein [Kribbella sp.]